MPEKIEALIYYSKKFERLRVDRAHGLAPHKPILLLAVIERIQKEYIRDNKIYLSQDLIDVFLKYWSYLGSFNHNPDISMPFFYMKSSKFWHLWPNPGYAKIISGKRKPKTLLESKDAIKYAYLDEDLFEFLQDETVRKSLLEVLISQWFRGQSDLVEEISQADEIKISSEYFRFNFERYITYGE